jgi:hypothetical protein
VRETHPVQSPFVHAARHVQVGVGVEVDQPYPPATAGDVAGDGSNADCAVATKDERRLAGGDRGSDASSGVPDDLDDHVNVLRTPILTVRPPAPDRSVAVVA